MALANNLYRSRLHALAYFCFYRSPFRNHGKSFLLGYQRTLLYLMAVERTVFTASPGTGKTTKLIDLVAGLLEKGVPPEKIGFTTFTKAGADHARDVAVRRFNLDPKRFRHFRTLHSLAYQTFQSPKIAETEPDLFKELTKVTGVPCTYYRRGIGEEGISAAFLGDIFLSLHNLARNRLDDARSLMLADKRFRMVDWTAYEQFINRYEQLKQFYRTLDYTGLIERFVQIQDVLVDIEYLFVDEAQDLTRLQWAMIQKLEETVQHSYVAGDDKQAIYQWAGASPETLIDLTGERRVLEQSYRLKSSVLELSEKIASRIKLKSPYAIKAFKEGGKVTGIRDLRALDLSQGSWLLLGRLNADLIPYQQLCDRLGYKYTTTNDNYAEIFEAIRIYESLRQGLWLTIGDFQKVLPYLPTGEAIERGYKKVIQEADPLETISCEVLQSRYGLRCSSGWYKDFKLPSYSREILHKMVSKEGATSLARIQIKTIHAAKGLEAQNVVLLPRLSSACKETLESLNPDPEHRVFYVAVTRAIDNFYHIQGDETFYPI